VLAAALCLALGIASGAAADEVAGAGPSEPTGVGEAAASDEEEPREDPSDAEGSSVADPWEPFNRKIFAFNDVLDRYALEPVGRGWAFVMPEFVRESLARVYRNIRTPVNMVNNLLQGQPKQAGVDLARFLMNTTVGLAGLMDPAQAIGLEGDREDFGQTFGVWGIPSGPYLVLPVFGPSSPRDTVGLAADSAAFAASYFIPFWASIAISSMDFVNRYSLIVEDIAEEREAAFDWYAAVRNAYVSRRERLVNDEAEVAEEDEDDLYYFDE
jgi:phospholipid-binding lipoprotein MlaA